MANLFMNSLFADPDEEGLTKALIAVLEHSDPLILSTFLSLVTGNDFQLGPDDDVRFVLQVPFKNDMPNARIRVPAFSVVIETSRTDTLDETRFRNHWENLHRRRDLTFLLSMTTATEAPPIIRELGERSTNPDLIVRHISWSRILEMVWGLQDKFPADSISRFLLSQFEDYLKPLTDCFYKGIKLETLADYGKAIRQVALHEETTKADLQQLLDLIQKGIGKNSTNPYLVWKIKKGFDPTGERVFFERLFAQSPCMPRSAGYCVLPYLELPDTLRFSYYFSLWTEGEKPLTDWLAAHQQEIRESCRDIVSFGQQGHNVFHISREIPGEKLPGLLAGDRECMDWTAETMASFFGTIEACLERAAKELAA